MLPLSIFSMLIACSDKPTPNNDEAPPPQPTEQKSKEVSKPPTFIQTAAEKCSWFFLNEESRSKIYSDGIYHISGDLINVRSKPYTKGSVVQQIPLGSEVTVGECLKKEVLNDIEGCWHPLLSVNTRDKQQSFDSDSAYLFSTAFGDCFIQADLDSDGVEEQVFLIARGQSEQLRIYDPNAKIYVSWIAPQYSCGAADIGTAGTKEHLFIEHARSCESDSSGTEFYSYQSHPKPLIKEVLSIGEGVDWENGQNFYDSVVFNEDGTATVTTSYSVMDEESEERKPSKTVQYCLRNGVFTQCSTPSNEEKDDTQSSAK